MPSAISLGEEETAKKEARLKIAGKVLSNFNLLPKKKNGGGESNNIYNVFLKTMMNRTWRLTNPKYLDNYGNIVDVVQDNSDDRIKKLFNLFKNKQTLKDAFNFVDLSRNYGDIIFDEISDNLLYYKKYMSEEKIKKFNYIRENQDFHSTVVARRIEMKVKSLADIKSEILILQACANLWLRNIFVISCDEKDVKGKPEIGDEYIYCTEYKPDGRFIDYEEAYTNKELPDSQLKQIKKVGYDPLFVRRNVKKKNEFQNAGKPMFIFKLVKSDHNIIYIGTKITKEINEKLRSTSTTVNHNFESWFGKNKPTSISSTTQSESDRKSNIPELNYVTSNALALPCGTSIRFEKQGTTHEGGCVALSHLNKKLTKKKFLIPSDGTFRSFNANKLHRVAKDISQENFDDDSTLFVSIYDDEKEDGKFKKQKEDFSAIGEAYIEMKKKDNQILVFFTKKNNQQLGGKRHKIHTMRNRKKNI